jgi:hypothetical protein
MKTRCFNFAALLSAAVATVIVLLWLSAGVGNIDGITPLATFSKDCHLTIFGHGADYRVAIYNDAVYGPYHGSIVGMAGPDGRTGIQGHGFGDTAGVYFRHFRWPGGAVLWTLMISLLYPLAISLVLPIIWICKNFQLRRATTR